MLIDHQPRKVNRIRVLKLILVFQFLSTVVCKTVPTTFQYWKVHFNSTMKGRVADGPNPLAEVWAQLG